MKNEVRYSGPKGCMRCGAIVRICYVDGEFDSVKEYEPLSPATEKNPNPIYALHKCEADDDETP